MPTPLFLTTTPNQRNYIRHLLHRYPGGKVVECDKFTPDDYRQLAQDEGDAFDEVWVPYYGSVDGIHCLDEMRKTRPNLKLVKFYESLMSYFAHPWFCLLYRRAGFDRQYYKADTADSFIGIREIDARFGRAPLPHAPSFADIYPARPAPASLAQAKGIFIGQPLAADTSLDEKIYHRVVEQLARSGKIDTYITHPREKTVPQLPLKIVRLPHPLECYRDVAGSKRLYTIFSTASAYYSLFHKNVHIADLDPRHFSISPMAHALYSWIKKLNPTVPIHLAFGALRGAGLLTRRNLPPVAQSPSDWGPHLLQPHPHRKDKK